MIEIAALPIDALPQMDVQLMIELKEWLDHRAARLYTSIYQFRLVFIYEFVVLFTILLLARQKWHDVCYFIKLDPSKAAPVSSCCREISCDLPNKAAVCWMPSG